MSEGHASVKALNEQGNARKAAGDLAGAIESYRQALVSAPGHLSALFNLGLALEEAGDAAGAEASFRKVVQLDPSDGEAWFHLGLLLRGRDERTEGLQALERAASLLPDSADVRGDWGMALLNDGRGAEAASCLEEALRLSGPNAELYNNLGAAWQIAGRWRDGEIAFQNALSVDPALLQAHLNLGDHLAKRGEWAGAAERFAEGMRFHPEFPPFVDRLLFAMQQVCDWSRFDELRERRLAALRSEPHGVTPPFSLLSIPSTAAEQRQCAAAMARRIEQRIGASAPVRSSSRRTGQGRLRIGYLSADFYEHVTAYVLAELLELHDRSCFEIFAYSCGPDDRSALRTRISRSVDHFVELGNLSDVEAARRIGEDQIDILLDVNGYTQSARTGITPYRPAAVQVNYLGYPGTLAAPCIDYVVADPFIFTPQVAQGFTEQPILMPGCYAPNDRRRELGPAPPRETLGLPEDAFVFCCFNQAFKVLPQVFDAWMSILRSIPASVLWLLEANDSATKNLRNEAVRRGVDPARIIFAPRVPALEYLARLPAADLFLDTWPYNAHTTAADALWAGLPVLTLAGDTFASRVAGSMACAAGLPELVTGSIAEYEATAIRLARRPDELASLRMRLIEGRGSAVLFDTTAYARSLEEAFRHMHRLAVDGRRPERIEVQTAQIRA